jgi:hypothetical protein
LPAPSRGQCDSDRRIEEEKGTHELPHFQATNQGLGCVRSAVQRPNRRLEPWRMSKRLPSTHCTVCSRSERFLTNNSGRWNGQVPPLTVTAGRSPRRATDPFAYFKDVLARLTASTNCSIGALNPGAWCAAYRRGQSRAHSPFAPPPHSGARVAAGCASGLPRAHKRGRTSHLTPPRKLLPPSSSEASTRSTPPRNPPPW